MTAMRTNVARPALVDEHFLAEDLECLAQQFDQEAQQYRRRARELAAAAAVYEQQAALSRALKAPISRGDLFGFLLLGRV